MSGFVKSDNQKHIRRTTKRTQQQAIIDKTGTQANIVRHIHETVTILCYTSNFPYISPDKTVIFRYYIHSHPSTSV